MHLAHHRPSPRLLELAMVQITEHPLDRHPDQQHDAQNLMPPRKVLALIVLPTLHNTSRSRHNDQDVADSLHDEVDFDAPDTYCEGSERQDKHEADAHDDPVDAGAWIVVFFRAVERGRVGHRVGALRNGR